MTYLVAAHSRSYSSWWRHQGPVSLRPGPAAELKEQVDGHRLVECADVEEAIRWAATVPADPGGWLVTVARRRAIDRLRREAMRSDKEAAAVRELDADIQGEVAQPVDDELPLIFMCCHPAPDPAARVSPTLRCCCGLSTAEIAAAFLVAEPTMAKRLVRTRQKIRDAGIPLRLPLPDALPARLAAVLRVIYVVFTERHRERAFSRSRLRELA